MKLSRLNTRSVVTFLAILLEIIAIIGLIGDKTALKSFLLISISNILVILAVKLSHPADAKK